MITAPKTTPELLQPATRTSRKIPTIASFLLAPALPCMIGLWVASYEVQPARGSGGVLSGLDDLVIRSLLFLGSAALLNLLGLTLGIAGALSGERGWRIASGVAAGLNVAVWGVAALIVAVQVA